MKGSRGCIGSKKKRKENVDLAGKKNKYAREKKQEREGEDEVKRGRDARKTRQESRLIEAMTGKGRDEESL